MLWKRCCSQQFITGSISRILHIVEERLSARLSSGAPVDPAMLASEIIHDALSKGFSRQELKEIIEVAAEELDVPMVRPLRRMPGGN